MYFKVYFQNVAAAKSHIWKFCEGGSVFMSLPCVFPADDLKANLV